ncbi:hypothetical protein GTO10_05940 [Candidatus Saccharibacteria bacterium]|nr:hypothetical protein [Candidatus Saccharibacteria bacterium]
MNDPVFLALVGIVILLTLALVVVLGLWVRKLHGENGLLRAAYNRVKPSPREGEVADKSQDDLLNTVVGFALAYRERVQARGNWVKPANTKMRVLWGRLPREVQAELVPLAILADLKVSE